MALSPRTKRIIAVSITVIVAALVTALLLNFVPALNQYFLESFDTAEILTALAVVVSVLAITINIVRESIRSKYSPQRKLLVKAKVENSFVTITCSFENKGSNRIRPHHFYLFIDEGKIIDENEFVDFYNPLCHINKDSHDCQLGKICKDSVVADYPRDLITKDYENVLHKFFRLKHLAPDSITYIDPGEFFSEDITIKLAKGVYRAILVGIAKNQDCICANVHFIVAPSDL